MLSNMSNSYMCIVTIKNLNVVSVIKEINFKFYSILIKIEG